MIDPYSLILTARDIQYLPLYSGKHMVNGLCLILSSNKSFLLRKRIIDVSTNHLLLQILSNSFIDSIIRFISSSSASTKSYPDKATQNMIEVTPSKQWIHFFLSDLCPPTSNILKCKPLKLNCVSMMPVVFTLVLRTSCCVGTKCGEAILSSWFK